MKKITSAFAALILLLSIMAGALAQEQTTTDQNATKQTAAPTATNATETTEQVGITPDSPLLWGLERAIERIDMLLTFNKAAKAKKGLEHARERLAEVKKMIEEKKLDAAAKAEKAHEQDVKEAEDNIAEIDEDNATTELEKEVELYKEVKEQQTQIENIRLHVEGTLTPEQQAAVDALIASFKNSTASVEIKVNAEKENTKIKIKVKEGKSDKEVDELEDELEDEHGIGTAVRELARAQRESEEKGLGEKVRELAKESRESNESKGEAREKATPGKPAAAEAREEH